LDSLEELVIFRNRDDCTDRPKETTGVRIASNMPRGLLNLTVHAFVHPYELELDQLPPSLTKLHLHCNEYHLPYEGFKLPPTLTHFAATAEDQGCDWLAVLPSSVTILDVLLSGCNNRKEMLDIFSRLPQNLVSLYAGDYLQLDLSPDTLSYLPTGLTHLTLYASDIGSDHIAKLPRTLTSLDLGIGVWSKRMAEECPRGLRKFPDAFDWSALQVLPCSPLFLDLCNTSLPDDLSSIPAHLPSLRTFRAPPTFNETMARHLFASATKITDIDLYEISVTSAMLSYLPRTATNLTMGLRKASPFPDDGIRLLPPSLTSLQIRYHSDRAVSTISSLSGHLRMLTSLELKGWNLPQKWFRDLPPNLELLFLLLPNYALTFDDIQDLGVSCPCLSHLVLEVGKDPTAEEKERLSVAYLPNLVQLSLSFTAKDPENPGNPTAPWTLPPNFSQTLPRRIRQLFLIGAKIEFSDSLRLPRSLKKLYFNYAPPNWFKPYTSPRYNRSGPK
jgi:hypothetical protein